MYIYVKTENHFENVIFTVAQPIMKKCTADIETCDGILNPVKVELSRPTVVNDDKALRRAARILQKRWRKANGFSLSRRRLRRLLLMQAVSPNYQGACWTY